MALEQDLTAQSARYAPGVATRPSRRSLAYSGVYLGAIVAANLLAATYGPPITPFVAFALIGCDLSLRDKLHDAWQRRGLGWKMAALIATGSLLSWWLNRNAGPIALASFAAFAAASIADGVAYQALQRRGWYVRSNGSNLAGAAVDSLVFPALAFGAWLPWIVLAQFAAKMLGGLVWSWLLRRRND